MTTTEPSAALALEPRWWEDPTRVTDRWIGVFKGGGAKGIAYVGALHAVAEERIWFDSVAGSSAGAISATLIAAGLDPEEIEACSPGLLGRVKTNRLGLLLGGTRAIFSMGGVVAELRSLLRTQCQKYAGTASDDPTFTELFEATGIELCVVGLDLASSQPIVFSHTTTPECQVALAVAASSAIPVAFESGRLVALSGFETDPWSVHRVVDGGAWANYPAFVYKDPSFRRFAGMPELAPGRRIVGFVLDQGGGAFADTPWRFRPDAEVDPATDIGTYVSSRKAAFVLRKLDKTRWRLLALVAWPIAMVVATAATIGTDLDHWEAVRLELAGVFPLGRVLVYGTFAIAAALMLTISLAAYFLGRQIIRVGIGTVLASMQVSTDVPAWIGAHPDDHVVRIPVPGSIGTTTFKIAPEVQRDVIDRAAAATRSALDVILRPEEGPALAPARSTELPKPSEVAVRAETHAMASRFSLGALLLLGTFGVIVVLSTTMGSQISGLPLDVGALVGSAWVYFIPAVAGVWLYARGGEQRDAVRAEEQTAALRWNPGDPVSVADDKILTERKVRRRIVRRTICLVGFGVLFVLALVAGFGDQGSYTGWATVIGRVDTSEKTFLYTVRIAEGEPGAGEEYDLDSHQQIAVGQRVRLRAVPGHEIELQSDQAFGAAAWAALTLYLTVLSGLGIWWAKQDQRWLQEHPEMNPPWGDGGRPPPPRPGIAANDRSSLSEQ